MLDGRHVVFQVPGYVAKGQEFAASYVHGLAGGDDLFDGSSLQELNSETTGEISSIGQANIVNSSTITDNILGNRGQRTGTAIIEIPLIRRRIAILATYEICRIPNNFTSMS